MRRRDWWDKWNIWEGLWEVSDKVSLSVRRNDISAYICVAVMSVICECLWTDIDSHHINLSFC